MDLKQWTIFFVEFFNSFFFQQSVFMWIFFFFPLVRNSVDLLCRLLAQIVYLDFREHNIYLRWKWWSETRLASLWGDVNHGFIGWLINITNRRLMNSRRVGLESALFIYKGPWASYFNSLSLVLILKVLNETENLVLVTH